MLQSNLAMSKKNERMAIENESLEQGKMCVQGLSLW